MGITGIFAVQGFVSLGSVVAVTQLSGQVIAPASTFASLLGKVKAAYPVLRRLYATMKKLRLTIRNGTMMQNVKLS